MTKQVGLYYWRGHALPLLLKGNVYCVKVPTELLARFRADTTKVQP